MTLYRTLLPFIGQVTGRVLVPIELSRNPQWVRMLEHLVMKVYPPKSTNIESRSTYLSHIRSARFPGRKN